MYATVEMKICNLKPCFDDAKWISDKSAKYSGKGGNSKIFKSRLILFFQISKDSKVDIATQASFHGGSNESLIESFVAVLF